MAHLIFHILFFYYFYKVILYYQNKKENLINYNSLFQSTFEKIRNVNKCLIYSHRYKKDNNKHNADIFIYQIKKNFEVFLKYCLLTNER